MKTRVILLTTAALLSTAALAADKPDSSGNGAGNIFSTLDTDGDGKISKQEAAANERFASHFDALDGNSDGFVTKREYHRNTMPKPKSQF